MNKYEKQLRKYMKPPGEPFTDSAKFYFCYLMVIGLVAAALLYREAHADDYLGPTGFTGETWEPAYNPIPTIPMISDDALTLEAPYGLYYGEDGSLRYYEPEPYCGQTAQREE